MNGRIARGLAFAIAAGLLQDFRWHYGQPEDVRRAFREAMGLEAES